MDNALLQAYRATDYHVHAEAPFTLRVDEASAACDDVMDAHGITTGAFLTAWNPHSRQVSSAENASAQENLAIDLAAFSVAVHTGEGVGRIGDWPAEPSLFALGVSRDMATSLAKKYRQNAFVWIERGKPSELVLCGA